MKKTNFFKLLMVGAAALTLGLSSCVSKSDFDAVCEDLSTAKADIATIQSRLDGLDYVSKVQLKSGTNNVLEIFTKGGTAPAATLTIEGGSGGGTVISKENGFWKFGDEVTIYPVESPAGDVPAPVLNPETGFWQFWDVEDGAYVDDEDYPAVGAYYTVETETSITLYVWSKEDGKLMPIILAKYVAGSDIAKIDILGWVKTGDIDANGNLDLDTVEENNDPAKPFAVKYAWIEKFMQDTHPEAANNVVGDLAERKNFTWEGKTTVKVKNVLNTLSAEGMGIVVSVFPSNADLADPNMVFKLQDSKNGVLPLKMGTPKQITGLLTRADAENSGVWVIPFTYEGPDATYDKGTPAAPENNKYSDKFTANAMYSLVMPSGLRSEYGKFKITAAAAAAVNEVAVSKVGGKAIVAGVIGGVTAAYVVEVNKDYDVEFAAPNNVNVVDYYLEVADDSNGYIKGQFGVSFDKSKGTFKVTIAPDIISAAGFKLRVYKLAVTGAIYVEDVWIFPTRDKQQSVIRESSKTYLVNDADGSGAAGLLVTAEHSDLTPMFNVIKDIPSGTMTLLDRWQSDQAGVGAAKVTLSSVTIDGKALTGDASGYKDPVSNANLSVADFADLMTNNSGVMAFVDKTSSPGVTVAVPAAGTVTNPNLYKTRFFKFQPAYARTATTQPMFDIGKEYVLTFDFTDASDVYLSSAIVKFTPTIPALAGFIKKQDAFWDKADKTILNAYYPDPKTRTADDEPTSYNVAEGAAGNGGFEKLGGSGSDTTWAEVDLALDLGQKDGTWVYAWNPNGTDADKATDFSIAYAAKETESTTNRKFSLAYQNNVITDFALIDGTGGYGEAYPASKPTGYKDAYGLPMNVQVIAKYLNVYSYGEGDNRDKSADFKIKMMSALFEGDIVAMDGNAEAPAIEAPAAAGGKTYRFGADKISGTTYNGQKYSVFQEWIGGAAAYLYTYIKSVEFSVPAADVNKYFIVDAAGLTEATAAIAPVAPTADDDGKSYVNIRPGNISDGETVGITVKVSDRFGKSKSKTLNLKLTTAE